MAEVAKILTVDDDADIRQLIDLMVNRAGYEHQVVTTGQQTLAHLASQPVDLLLLDFRLPDMSGAEIYQQVKTDPAYPADMGVIFLTAWSDNDLSSTLADKDTFLTKPFDFDEFFAKVEQTLRLYGKAHLIAGWAD